MSLIKNLFILLLLSLATVVGGLFYWSGQVLDTEGKNIAFTIKSGSSVRSASKQMQDAGLPVPAIFFELMARASGKASKLKAGSYELEPGKPHCNCSIKLSMVNFHKVR